MPASVRDSDKSTSYFPLAGLAQDGYNKPEENEATATCFCGAVQLAFVSRLSHVIYKSEIISYLHEVT